MIELELNYSPPLFYCLFFFTNKLKTSTSMTLKSDALMLKMNGQSFERKWIVSCKKL